MKVDLGEFLMVFSGMDEASFFLDRKTGELIFLTDEEFSYCEDEVDPEDIPEWQRERVELAKAVSESFEDYFSVGDHLDFNGYKLMERFIETIKDERTQNRFWRAINGRGAFRMFRAELEDHDLLDDWYKFKDHAEKEYAKEFLTEHGFEYE